MNIKSNKIKQFFLWFLAYLPIILIIVFRAWGGKWYLSIIFVIISIIIYFFSGKLYLLFEKRQVKNNAKKIGSIKTNKVLPISEYSYFILTLFMPLLFEDISSSLDYTIFGTLILLILIIFTKNDYIIINPLFLLANYHVFKVKITNADKVIDGYAIVNKKIDLDKKVHYKKLFPNIFFIFEEAKTNETEIIK